ncbi:4Fe-4S dicluster domain-containing protein [Peptococcus niger]|uniref:[FeFe] hydrogenase, group B1/B3 n=1 Tax=Peptococcus niger TaxID=2741 RepID=A0A1G6ZPU4_PEPNI|nr:4Fe-4S dicluster domain-containing protein [Peptococcus niger]SDE03586.1 [FeFe] hydrogenase, group B1/B3 [Peptococcus niger]
MKQVYSDVIAMRRDIFREIARLAYEDGDLHDLRQAVFNILPGESPLYGTDIFRERAIAGERLRLGLGLSVRDAGNLGPLDDDIDLIDAAHRVYEPPLVNVIPFACQACPTKTVSVTNNCRACIGHPCKNVCPKDAIDWNSKDGATINEVLCIRCGRCADYCPYNAIIKYDRPCAANCGVKAIGSDDLGRAEIDHNKCVSCGRCITECPFGAISDKSQIYQLIRSIKAGDHHVAIVAPSFVGQFGNKVSPEQIFEAIYQIGFTEVMEVGLGADLTTLQEAEEFVHLVPDTRPFMGTSCCNSWSLMIQKIFPDIAPYVSETATPMIETAYYIKQKNPDAKVTFIGPCISKKLEALRHYVKNYVDFVITFEELGGILSAKGFTFEAMQELEPRETIQQASKTARGYASGGGVATAVAELIAEKWPEVEVNYEGAEGLDNCVKLMKLAKAGKKNGMLLEGMACEGGCLGGPGTLAALNVARRALQKFKDDSTFASPTNNELIHHFDPECITRAKESDHEEEHRVEVAAKVSKLAYEKRKQQEN